MFRGGPDHIYSAVRPITEEDEANASVKRLAPEDDKEWQELVKHGGAGDRPDTVEEQKARYELLTTNENDPGGAKYQIRDPDVLITCSLDYTLKTWDCRNNFKLLQTFEGHHGQVHETLPYRNNMILSGGDDMTLRLWKRGDTPYGELVFTYWINEFPIKCICVLPGQRCGAGGLDKIFRVISLVTGHTLHRLDDHGKIGPDNDYFQFEGCGSVWCLLHLKGNLVVTGSDDATLRVWDIDKGKCLSTTIGHQGWGRDIGPLGWGLKLSETFAGIWRLIHLGDSGKHFASCSYDRTIAIWDASKVDAIKRERMWKAHENATLNIAIQDAEHLISIGADKEFKLWNWTTGELITRVDTRGIPAQGARVSDGVAAIAGGDTTIRIFDWKAEQDLMGEHGWNAHDFIITNMSRVFLEDDDEALWTQTPILYRSCTVAQSNTDAQSAINLMRNCLQDALTFEEFS